MIICDENTYPSFILLFFLVITTTNIIPPIIPVITPVGSSFGKIIVLAITFRVVLDGDG